jgi:hypothetical protein
VTICQKVESLSLAGISVADDATFAFGSAGVARAVAVVRLAEPDVVQLKASPRAAAKIARPTRFWSTGVPLEAFRDHSACVHVLPPAPDDL